MGIGQWVAHSEQGLAGNDQGRGKLLVLLLAEQRKTNDLLERLLKAQQAAAQRG